MPEAVPVPPGETIPVSLEHGLRAGRSLPGAPVTGYVTQRVPLSAASFLPRGAEVLGTVVRSAGADGPQPAQLALRFDRMRLRGKVVPLRVRVVALASAAEVRGTDVPVNGIADRETPGPANWTTQQVGGDVLTRSGWIGELDSDTMRKVGFADFNGVYGSPGSGGCSLPRALGAFSAGAQGLYGFGPSATLRSQGGEATVSSPGKLELESGTELLLGVVRQ